MTPDDLSVLERQEQEALAALKAEFPDALINTPGCDHRYEVCLASRVQGPFGQRIGSRVRHSQVWEYDTLPAVRQRIVWALANR